MRQNAEKTVLVIEDDRRTADLVALYLKRDGFRTLTAGDGVRGLALAERHRPDLVILDLDLKREATDLEAAVENALAFYSRAFAEKKIEVVFHPVQAAATLAVDRRRIARVLRNLSDNAARYTPPNGRLDVRIAAVPKGLRVEYRNTAGELTPEDLPFLFERFYRGEKSRSRRHGGAGIGLAIVKELVEAHGGRVGSESAEGRIGIWFELPATPDAAPPPA